MLNVLKGMSRGKKFFLVIDSLLGAGLIGLGLYLTNALLGLILCVLGIVFLVIDLILLYSAWENRMAEARDEADMTSRIDALAAKKAAEKEEAEEARRQEPFMKGLVEKPFPS